MRCRPPLFAFLGLVLSVLPGRLEAAPGDLDSSFGDGGRVILDLQNGSDDRGYCVAVQSDGNYVVAGSSASGGVAMLALARYLPDGALDTSFGEGGKTTAWFPDGTGVSQAAGVQSDGRIVVMTHASSAMNRLDFYGFTSTGQLDSGFGTGGRASIDLVSESIQDMKLQSDGKIVVCGYRSFIFNNANPMLMRLTAQGALDTTFGSNGRAVNTSLSNSWMYALALQSDGKIVAAGTAGHTAPLLLRYTPAGVADSTFGDNGVASWVTTGSFVPRAVAVTGDGVILTAAYAASPNTIQLARCTAAGALDITFGTDGMATGPMTVSLTSGLEMDLQTDGKIILTGESSSITANGGSIGSHAVARFTEGGAPDTDFGTGGQAVLPTVDFPGGTRRPALLGDGKLLIAHSAAGAGGDVDFYLTKLTDNGTPDAGFGTAGTVVTPVSLLSLDVGRNVLPVSDRKLLVAGWTQVAGTYQLVLLRCLPGGAVDASFGVNGRLQIPLSGGNDDECALALQPDGRIIAAVNVWTGDEYRLTLVRCLPGGTLDAEFGAGGVVTTPVFSSDDEDDDDTGASVAVQADGKIVAGGSRWNGMYYHFALARYSAGGEPDASFGSGGLTVTPAPASRRLRSLALQPDGKILAAGYAGSSVMLTRYTTAGVPDATFGTAGNAQLVSGQGRSVVVLSDGRIVVSGIRDSDPDLFFVARYTSAGAVDTSFNATGVFSTGAPSTGAAVDARGGYLTVQNDGKYIVSGYTRDRSGSGAILNFAMVRCTAGGALDTGFGAGGKRLTPLGGAGEEAGPMAVQSDGKLVAAGVSRSTSEDFVLARWDPGPAAAQVSGGTVTDLTSTGAVLQGMVNPSGTATAAQIRWGTSTSYGNSTPVPLSPADGTSPQPFSATLSGLLPNTLYHWQVTATNGGGLNSTGDFTFRTMTRLQNWRLQWFGSSADSGPGADSADPDNDGTNNILEFSLNGDPLTAGVLTASAVLNGSSITYTYTRSKAAVSDNISFMVEYAATPGAGPWSSTGVTQTILSDNGTVQQVRAVVPAGMGPRRFVRLTVRRF